MITSATFRTVVAPTGVDKGVILRLYWILCALLEWTCFILAVISIFLSDGFDGLDCPNAGAWRYVVLSLGITKSFIVVFFLRSRWCLWCLCPNPKNDKQRTLSSVKILCTMSLHFLVAVLTCAYELGIPTPCWDALGITNRAALNLLLWGSVSSSVAYMLLACMGTQLSNGRHKLSSV